MGKQRLDKKKLLNEIESKIQGLNLLHSTLKADRSRKPETLEDYEQQLRQLLAYKNKTPKK